MTESGVPIVKVSNVDNPLEAWCSMCGNTGWVELAGTVRALGVTYSRGMAPCRWCQLGVKRFERATSPPRDKHDHHRRWEPASRFAAGDVIPFGEQTPRPARSDRTMIRELPGLEDAPVRDFEAAARSCYAAWRRFMGKAPADAKVRQHYPDQAEAVILEADALDVPAEPSDVLDVAGVPVVVDESVDRGVVELRDGDDVVARVEPSVQDELDDAAIQRDRAGVDDEDVPL
jgi:hypothetical protein